MLKDRYGNLLSTTSQAARDKFDEACYMIRLYRGDPVAALDEALSEDPEFGGAWAARAGLLVQQMDNSYAVEIEKSLRAGAAANLTDRDRAHLTAAQAWSEGRFHDATVQFAKIAQDTPRDLLALQTAHIGCFFLGRASELRDWPLAAVRGFSPGDDGYHAVLGMAAFGYEECGQYDQAQAMGQEAVSLEPKDAWAVHAVAHAYEMRGDTRKGIPWLAESAGAWAPDCGFAFHNWWHLALLHLDRGDIPEVLRLYDENIRREDSPIMLEWIDAAAMLWRLRLEGIDVGERWHSVAAQWHGVAEQRHYAFNDVHAVMAFLGAGRALDVARTVASMRRAAAGSGDNADMTRAVGLPVAEALVAFDSGDYAQALEKLAAVRGIAQRFGGSHAQRDILSLTMVHAALRGGLIPAAEALAAERAMHKPKSPWARALRRKAQILGEQQRAA
jgi:tetratricopeptide (TPR) repeat protein